MGIDIDCILQALSTKFSMLLARARTESYAPRSTARAAGRSRSRKIAPFDHSMFWPANPQRAQLLKYLSESGVSENVRYFH